MTEADWLSSTDPAAMLAHIQGKVADRKLRLFAVAVCRLMWPLLSDARSRAAVERAERFADGLATEEERQAAMRGAYLAHDTRRPTAVTFLPWSASAGDRVLAEQELGAGSYFFQALAANGISPAAQAAMLREVVGNPFRAVTLPKGPLCLLCGGKGQIDRPIICGPNTSEDEMRRIADEAGGPIPCPSCRRTGHQPCPWLTPTVTALALAAYGEPRRVECGRCGGTGKVWDFSGPDDNYDTEDCPGCSGTGTTTDGLLDPDRLAVLRDALEDAGCTEEVLLRHLRATCPACTDKSGFVWGKVADCRTCHGSGHATHARGCFALDLVLGKE